MSEPFGVPDQKLPARSLTVVIVGGGAAGEATKRALIHQYLRRELCDSLQVVLIEPRPAEQSGMGLAWSSSSDRLLVNMPAHTICVDTTTASAFGDRLGIGGQASTTELFPPRRKIGEMLHADAVAAEALAVGSGISIRRVQATAIGVERVGRDRLAVRIECGRTVVADAVVLATGNVASTEYSHLRGSARYIACGWEPEKWCTRIPGNARVMMIGAGVSAIDGAVVLQEHGHCGPISFVSRNGLLPGVRGRHDTSYKLKFLDDRRIRALAAANSSKRLSGPEVYGHVMNEMFEAQVSHADLKQVWDASRMQPQRWLATGLATCNLSSSYFTVMKALDEFIPDLWNALDDAGRHHFRAHVLSDYARIAWPMAPVNGQRIHDMLATGSLTVSGGLESIRHERGVFIATVVQEGKGKREIKADWVVNATGIGGRLDQMDNPLIDDLLRHGLALPDVRYGGALSDFDSGRLLTVSGAPTGPIWATAGALTRGTRLLTNVLSEAGASGRRTATAVLDFLVGEMDEEPTQPDAVAAA